MNLETEMTFAFLKISLCSIEEVKELQGILAQVEYNSFSHKLYKKCEEITGVPMSGLYKWECGELVRSHK